MDDMPSGSVSAEPAGHREGSRGFVDAMKGMLPSLVLDVLLPIVTYYVLSGRGMDPVLALVLSGVWPLASIVASLIRRRRLDEFGVFILVLIILGSLTSLLLHDPRLVLLKDSAFTGILGIVFLATLAMKRPLTFYFGRKFGTDGSAAGIARWDGFWGDLSVFRRGQRIMTLVWGLALLAEALVRIPLVYVVPLDAMVAISNFLPFVVIAALIFWTISYGKRNATASKRQAGRLT